jgi:hypothetical protein
MQGSVTVSDSTVGETQEFSKPLSCRARCGNPRWGCTNRATPWPLLVLDAGAFLARCRRCSWKTTRESTPGAALVAFEAHSCAEPAA